VGVTAIADNAVDADGLYDKVASTLAAAVRSVEGPEERLP
jgi:hypothetical protein